MLQRAVDSIGVGDISSGPIMLVLLPGLDGTDVFFRPLLAVLSERITPLVVQFPSSTANGYQDLLGLTRHALVAVQRCYVLGWSFSGPLALMLAAAEPEKVRGVILASSFVRPPRRLFALLRWASVTPLIWLFRAIKRIPVWLSRASNDRLRRDKTETWERVSAKMIASRIRTLLAVDARPLLRTCPCPVLCVAGQDDQVVPHHNVEEMANVRASLHVLTIAGGHFAIYTNPSEIAAAIEQFMLDKE
ncbi:MAG TPA: alpha/beta hydrolase [Nitrospira sp.]|nr:alpha/beta hydrolase [Nitrospira sp.]